MPHEVADRIFEPSVEVQLLRIVQEAHTNAREHAQAQCARVTFCLEDGRVQVIVEDDGAGFDIAQSAEKTRPTFGLRLMRERAEEIGGSIEVHSAGKGTRGVVQVPLRKSADRAIA